MVGLILLVWRGVAQPLGYADVGIAAFGVLAVFALAWIVVMRRFTERAAMTAVAAIVLSEFNLIVMVFMPLPASFALDGCWRTSSGSSCCWHWPPATNGRNAASVFSILAGGAAAAILLMPDHIGRDVLIQAGAIYAPFALYPLVLGSRARESRDPYIAALIAGVWCFLIARHGMADANLDWMVGVVPVGIGAVTVLHLSQLLRIQPCGTRDLGRLALVAGAALAFLTVAIPLQLEQRWITIGWALEGAAVAWLYTRIPSPRPAAERLRPARRRVRPARAQSRSVPVRAARRHAHRQLVPLHVCDRRGDHGHGRLVALEDGR